MAEQTTSTMKLSPASPLREIPYVRVLEFAAGKAAGTGRKHHDQNASPGFSFEELTNDPSIKEIEESWLKEILPSICTVRDGEGNELAAGTKLDAPQKYRFVVKSGEFIKFANLVQVEQLGELLGKSNALLEKSEAALGAATTLVAEAKASGTTANRALFAACIAVVVAIAVPPIVVRFMTSTVSVVSVPMDEKAVAELVHKTQAAVPTR